MLGGEQPLLLPVQGLLGTFGERSGISCGTGASSQPPANRGWQLWGAVEAGGCTAAANLSLTHLATRLPSSLHSSTPAGAYHDRAADATAFPHRDAYFVLDGAISVPPSIRAMIPPDAIELLARPSQLLNGYLRCAAEAGGRAMGVNQGVPWV